MSRYKFALRPRWLVSHLLVVALVVAMVNLGFWQLRRLDERQAANSLVEERAALPVAPLDEVVDPGAGFGSGAAADAAHRRATAAGSYDPDAEVLVRNRSLRGQPGAWVLTPLVLDDGAAVVVNRGWVPAQGAPEGVPTEAAAPGGRVSVEGRLQESQVRGRFGPTDPADGELEALARADLARLQAQVPYDLYPVYLQLDATGPAASLPEPLPPPDLDDGPHLGYAFQWFAFATIAAVGYPLVLRRRAAAEPA